MGPYFDDAIRKLLAAAATGDGIDDCTAVIPETLVLLAHMRSLSVEDLRILARNTAFLAQCAEAQAARGSGCERDDHGVA